MLNLSIATQSKGEPQHAVEVNANEYLLNGLLIYNFEL